jgi:hypothetical protein
VQFWADTLTVDLLQDQGTTVSKERESALNVVEAWSPPPVSCTSLRGQGLVVDQETTMSA